MQSHTQTLCVLIHPQEPHVTPHTHRKPVLHISESLHCETPSQSRGLTCFSFPQELPPLPVPDLHRTLERYLAGLRAVIPVAQWTKTRQLAEEFAEGLGPTLQQELVELAQNVDNWVSKNSISFLHFYFCEKIRNKFYKLSKCRCLKHLLRNLKTYISGFHQKVQSRILSNSMQLIDLLPLIFYQYYYLRILKNQCPLERFLTDSESFCVRYIVDNTRYEMG